MAFSLWLLMIPFLFGRQNLCLLLRGYKCFAFGVLQGNCLLIIILDLGLVLHPPQMARLVLVFGESWPVGMIVCKKGYITLFVMTSHDDAWRLHCK